MYIRSKVVKGAEYFQVVQGVREGGRVRHRTLVSLGRHPTVAEALEHEKRVLTARKRELTRLRRDHPDDPSFPDPSMKVVDRILLLTQQVKAGEDKIARLQAVLHVDDEYEADDQDS